MDMDHDALADAVAKKLEQRGAARGAEINRAVAAETKKHLEEQRALRAAQRAALPSDYRPELIYDSDARTLTIRFGDHAITRQSVEKNTPDLQTEMALALWGRIQRHRARNSEQ